MTPPHRRAPALAPDERRAQLAEAYLAVALRVGDRPTSRQVADEAGVAEGTIFRAFATKEELDQFAVETAICPASWLADLRALPDAGDLDRNLLQIVTKMQKRFGGVFSLMRALHLHTPPTLVTHGDCIEHGCHVESSNSALDPSWVMEEIIARLVAPYADQLTCTPTELVRYLRLFTFAGSHVGITDGARIDPPTIVHTVLHGVIRKA